MRISLLKKTVKLSNLELCNEDSDCDELDDVVFEIYDEKKKQIS
jgi:hypothetical protein